MALFKRHHWMKEIKLKENNILKTLALQEDKHNYTPTYIAASLLENEKVSPSSLEKDMRIQLFLLQYLF